MFLRIKRRCNFCRRFFKRCLSQKNIVAEIETSEGSPIRSTGVMSSYGVGKFLAEFFTVAFGALVFFYFEIELGLITWKVTVAC